MFNSGLPDYVKNDNTCQSGKNHSYIPAGSSYDIVLDTLYSKLDIKHHEVFEWVAKKKSILH